MAPAVVAAYSQVEGRGVGSPLEGDHHPCHFPAPDDETLGCGCLISQHSRAESLVHIAFVTDGGASHPGHPILSPALLAERRKAEALIAAKALGVPAERCHFLQAPDGRMSDLSLEERGRLGTALRALMTRVSPTDVYLPFRRDGSSEHEACFRLFQEALGALHLPVRIFEFPVWSWWSPRLLLGFALSAGRIYRLRPTADARQARAAALDAYQSQVAPTPPFKDSMLSKLFISIFLDSDEYFIESSTPNHDLL